MAYSVTDRRSLRGYVAARPGQVFEEAGGGVLNDVALVRLVLAVQGQHLREEARELPDVVAHQVEVGTLEVGFRVQEALWTLAPGNQDSLSVYAANLVFTIDEANSWNAWAKVGEEGWNSSTYSTIEMNGNALTLKNPEFTMALGSDILENAARTDNLDNVLGMNIYITMDLRLIAGLNSMSDPYKVKFARLAARFFTACGGGLPVRQAQADQAFP